MEFIKANLLNTTTQLAVNSNTSTAANLFSTDKYYQYYSDGLSADGTTCSISITFNATTSVSRIALIDTNFEEFSIFYNGSTASTFALQNADTSASTYLNNTDENKYFRFPTTACSSITINAKSTITANQEKRLGLFVVSDLEIALTKIPNAKAYKPKVIPKQVVHRLSDGGARINTVRRKREADLNLNYIDEAERDLLYELYLDDSAFNFCPFGTSTGWDGFMFEAVWDGDFNFYQFSDDASSSGFSGSISLMETPS